MATQPQPEFSRIALASDVLVARLELAQPPLNIIDVPMMQELLVAIEQVNARPDVSILVIEGNARAFSAGVDVAAHTPDQVEAMLGNFHAVIRALVTTPKVTLAAVHGHCLGGGAELAMMCDIAITADDANWGFPEIKLGCYPPVACAALSALVGQKHATDLILTGRQINGEEAAAMGLACEAVPAAQVNARVQERVAQLAQLSPAALAVTKKALYTWDAAHFDKGLARAEKTYLEVLMQTEDAHEGIRAFMERRQPQWRGR